MYNDPDAKNRALCILVGAVIILIVMMIDTI